MLHAGLKTAGSHAEMCSKIISCGDFDAEALKIHL